jgi:hypothetical protein
MTTHDLTPTACLMRLDTPAQKANNHAQSTVERTPLDIRFRLCFADCFQPADHRSRITDSHAR